MGLEENENEEMGQRQTVEAIGLDFRDGLLLLLFTPEATADDCMGGRTWARMSTKQRKTAVF